MATDIQVPATEEVAPTTGKVVTPKGQSRKHAGNPELQTLHQKAARAYDLQYALNPKRYAKAPKGTGDLEGTANSESRHQDAVNKFHSTWATYAAACKKAGVKP